ncbi:MAG: hypothetical protein AAFN11_06545, partial [Chloroflexota bacterium]
ISKGRRIMSDDISATFTLNISAKDLKDRFGFDNITQEGLDNLASALKDTLEDQILPELEFWDEEGELEDKLLLTE